MDQTASHNDLVNRLRSRLRAAIQGLVLRPLNCQDPKVETQLKDRLRLLPSAEQIVQMNEEQLRSLRKQVDRLMYDIDLQEDNRSYDQAVRKTHRTSLPPRRQPVTAQQANMDFDYARSPWNEPGHEWTVRVIQYGDKKSILSPSFDRPEKAIAWSESNAPQGAKKLRRHLLCDGFLHQFLPDIPSKRSWWDEAKHLKTIGD